MKSNRELREEAWKRLFGDGWFWKLLGGAILLGLCGNAISTVISSLVRLAGVTDFSTLVETIKEAKANGREIPTIDGSLVGQLVSSGLLELFIGIIVGGIVAYGTGVILKKCVYGDAEHWLGEAFAGFKCPFEMAWLLLRQTLIFMGWGILGGIPLGVAGFVINRLIRSGTSDLTDSAIIAFLVSVSLCAMVAALAVPFYRYRFLWLIKAENPELPAAECLRVSRKLMDGRKWDSFLLDMSYWRPLALLFAMIMLMCGLVGWLFWSGIGEAGFGPLEAMMILVLILLYIGLIVCGVVVSNYVSVGQGLFYREIKGAFRNTDENADGTSPLDA